MWIIVIALSMETIFGNALVIAAYKLERNISKQVNFNFIVQAFQLSEIIPLIKNGIIKIFWELNGHDLETVLKVVADNDKIVGCPCAAGK